MPSTVPHISLEQDPWRFLDVCRVISRQNPGVSYLEETQVEGWDVFEVDNICGVNVITILLNSKLFAFCLHFDATGGALLDGVPETVGP